MMIVQLLYDETERVALAVEISLLYSYNIERLKLWDKSRVTSVQISLNIGTLTRYCTLTRMPSHVASA